MFCWSQSEGMSSAFYPQQQYGYLITEAELRMKEQQLCVFRVEDEMLYPEELVSGQPSPSKRSGRMSYPMSGMSYPMSYPLSYQMLNTLSYQMLYPMSYQMLYPILYPMSYPMSGYAGTGHQGHLPFNSWAGKRTPDASDEDVEDLIALQHYLDSLR